MNRRNFLNNLLLAGASFTILPGANRVWKAVRPVKMIRVQYRTIHDCIEVTMTREQYKEMVHGTAYGMDPKQFMRHVLDQTVDLLRTPPRLRPPTLLVPCLSLNNT